MQLYHDQLMVDATGGGGQVMMPFEVPCKRHLCVKTCAPQKLLRVHGPLGRHQDIEITHRTHGWRWVQHIAESSSFQTQEFDVVSLEKRGYFEQRLL